MKGSSWNKPFVPERLREARMARGIKATELAEYLGVTKQAVSQYELGITTPKPEVLDAIIQKLDFPIRFFYSPIERAFTVPVLFRSMATAREEKDVLIPRMSWMVEILRYLRGYLEFAEPDFADLLLTREVEDLEEIEDLAVKVRKAWGLGLGPISHMIGLVENNGFIVTKLSVGKEKVDACSLIDLNDGDKRPLIFLNSDKSAVRSRLDVAHELGHVILHSWADPEYAEDKNNVARMEKEAFRFAAAFLMPAESFQREVFSANLDTFVSLKRRWKVSIGAMIHRCHELELITDNQNKYLNMQINSRGYKRCEPLDDEIIHEEPSTLRASLEALVEARVVSPSDILEHLPFRAADVITLCNLKSDFFADVIEKRTPPRLRVIK